MSNPQLSVYQPDNQARLEAFFDEVWRSSQFPFDPEGAHSDLRLIPEIYQLKGGQFWLMWLSSEIIGAVALKFLSDGVGEVKRLNIHHQFRGYGLGDRLLRHSLTWATDMSFHTARLDTIRNPGPALHLFQKYGFIEIPRYNDNPHADLFMELQLGGVSSPYHSLQGMRKTSARAGA